MNEPKPLYRCDLCKSVDYQDDVIGCKRCGFDEMKPIAQPQPEPASKGVTHQWRKKGTGPWWDGYPDHSDGDGPYETRTLYANPNEPVEVSKLAVYYYWTPKPETGWPTNLATWSQNPGPHKDWDVVAYVTLESANAAISSQQREPQEAADLITVTACYFPGTGDAELSWERDGKTFAMTVPVTPQQGNKLANIVWPCINHRAALSAPQEAGKAEGECPGCGGLGRIRVLRCEQCDGTGKILASPPKEAGKAETYTEFLKREFGEGMGQDRVSFSIGNVARAFGAGVESGKKEACKVEAVADEPVYWEYRHLDTANTPNRWSEWEICKPRNVHMNTAEDFKNEIQGYIDMGYRYELRALYLRPSQQALGEDAAGEFADWLCREMPPGTVISDSAWWAPKIMRAILAAAGGSEK